MKVAFLGNLADAPYRMAEYLRRKGGYDVQLYTRADCPVHGDGWFHVLSEDRYERFNQIRKALRDCQVVHAFTEYIWYPYLLRHEYIAHSTGSDLRETVLRPAGLRRKLLWRAFRAAREILYHQPDQEVFLQAFPSTPSRFVHIPLDLDYWRPMPTEGHGGPLRVFSPSSLNVRQKGSDLIPAIMRKLGDARLRAVDWGEDRGLLDLMECERLGKLTMEQMKENYRWADIVIGNLRVGSLGLVDFEGMACARPVVANIDVSAYVRYYDELPPVTDSSNAGRLRDPATREELSQEGRRWMEKYHDGELFLEEIRETYEG